MNVKAQGLLNAARYVEETYGADTLRGILATCSPAVRERHAGSIAINWHPLEEFTEFLVAIGKHIPDPQIGEKVGAAGARANTRGVMLQIGLLLSRPENVLQRSARMWRQFNDEGELALVNHDKNSLDMVITGMPVTPRVFCDSITGWARELVTSAGGKNATATHSECRANGNSRCLWHVRWFGSNAG